MAHMFAEITKEAVASALRSFRSHGVSPIKPYLNISRAFFPGEEVWLLDALAGTPLAGFLSLPGVVYVEPDEEHIYSVSRPLLWRDIYPFGTRSLSLGRQLLPREVGVTALPNIMAQVDVPRAHALGVTGRGTIILIVDTGVEGDRIPDENKGGGWTDDPDGDPWSDQVGHGTMVALIALAVAPGASIFSVKLRPGPNGGLMKESVMSAVEALVPVIEADPGLRLVMNNSWGTLGCQGEPYW